MAASQRAHNPYRTSILREPISAPQITFKTRIVLKTIKLKFKILRVLRTWKRTSAGRNIRRLVRRNFQAKNKADPHLAKRV